MDKIDILSGVGGYSREMTVYMPENIAIRQMIYFHASPSDGRKIGERLWRELRKSFRQEGTAFVMLGAEDWNRDLSPWPAGKIFREDEDFPGGGKEYLEDLCNQVIPQIEGRYPAMSSMGRRIIGGYSMGGLFALYAMLESPLFTDMISVSGSLWYEGMVEYVSEKAFARRGSAFFSLGQREPKTRNPVMARVGEQTADIVELMERRGFSVHFQWNPGNHFQDELGRMERAIQYMLGGGQ